MAGLPCRSAFVPVVPGTIRSVEAVVDTNRKVAMGRAATAIKILVL